ncbi:transglutaminase-like protein [Candidatus Koribacter versatilis Ellin345]|uniref:Transglutaminase-like protein n=1 Tax=Koribacter versatilis (strain Ellin345) TaxID=204669 RepID=Q1ILD1_KORVE|nr:transglutaminase family protein [Candidatus Koribacter versatilis]ABF42319.1 transglutaminase-like protein [Candidatus Koribacter versatilis Ellin345]
MYYSIRHLTKFSYASPVSESIMETRMRPRSDSNQRCLLFHLSVSPRCSVFSFRDHMGNHIHHFDIPGAHSQLVIVAEAVVEQQAPAALPDALPSSAWDDLDSEVERGDFWEMLLPSEFAKPTPLLQNLAAELEVRRKDDPLSVLRGLNEQLYRYFEYVPKSTRVDSPIDDALEARCGVCQDFAHIMISLVRPLGIPCRYVSGYLNSRSEDHNRSPETATHAWVEALLPGVGWVGFDPTNNLMAGERHIRTAIGRDYFDVPPTKGVFSGDSPSELSVAVRVAASTAPSALDEDQPIPADWAILVEKAQEPPRPTAASQTQQQQQ